MGRASCVPRFGGRRVHGGGAMASSQGFLGGATLRRCTRTRMDTSLSLGVGPCSCMSVGVVFLVVVVVCACQRGRVRGCTCARMRGSVGGRREKV